MTDIHESILFRNVAVGSRPQVDVRVGRDLIQEVGRSLAPRRAEHVLDGAGGALIPGLHDHHVHLRAAVAAQQSADLSLAATPADFDQMLAAAAAAATAAGRHDWLRVVGWDEYASGPLDRYRLDALAATVPVRVQHRSGAMWVLNSVAIAQAGVAGCDLPGVERDPGGTPTGRLLRLDGWLRDRVPSWSPASFEAQLADYASAAARLGITGFTDATPGRDRADVMEFVRLTDAGVVPQRLTLMAPPGVLEPGQGRRATGRVTLGPVKLMLDNETLPSVAELSRTIVAAHQAGSAVAVHCVTAEQLVLVVAALKQAGPDGDRVEHAGVVPPGYAEDLSCLGAAVVTQPGFIAARGDAYLRDVPSAERDWLYPCDSLIRAHVTVAAGTDAPFGPADPWLCIAAAISRRTSSGQVLGATERTSASRALELFLAAPDDIRQVRTVAPGQPADLCLLHLPLNEALAQPSPTALRATLIAGQLFA
jgi:predicted amidohydrolase YtcJ